jgi:predicted nucleotidyltransferase
MLAETADLGRVDLSVVDRVVEDLLDRGADISRLMLVGAHCRNGLFTDRGVVGV